MCLRAAGSRVARCASRCVWVRLRAALHVVPHRAPALCACSVRRGARRVASAGHGGPAYAALAREASAAERRAQVGGQYNRPAPQCLVTSVRVGVGVPAVRCITLYASCTLYVVVCQLY